MKFCRETLFEADRALFMNRKTGRVLPVKVVLKLISSHLKWPTKQNHREAGLLLTALCCIYFSHENQITIQQQ